jgi:SEC-C motif-containing protein
MISFMNAHLCPCHSGKPYASCCKPYHEGQPAPDALALMRSRYAAYALSLADYIIETTASDIAASKEEILSFSSHTSFENLLIREFIDGKKIAFVTFTAILKQKGQDVSFTEKSRFIERDGRWYYEHPAEKGLV